MQSQKNVNKLLFQVCFGFAFKKYQWFLRRTCMRNLAAMVVFVLSFCTNVVSAACGDHGTHHTSNEFTQTLRLDLPPLILSDNSAASIFGELGRKNYRANGTYGFYFNPCSRFKITGEFLREKLGYNFSTGKVHKWLGQCAIGGNFEYLFSWIWFLKSVDVGGYYSRSQSKHLSTITCPITPYGVPNHKRHIAGSNGTFLTAGVTLIPWCDATLRLAADYDWLKYRRINNHDRRAFNGGGTIEFSQIFFRDFALRLKGEIRSPFDYVGGELNWRTCTAFGTFIIGAFGGYTRGKEHLPDSTVAGIHLSFAYDGIRIAQTCCDSDPYCEWYGYASPRVDMCELLTWVSKPAVYVPQVLSIADGKTHKDCIPPTSTTIPTQVIQSNVTNFTINLSPFFTNPEGTGLTYAASGLPTGSGYSASINSVTGVITGVNAQHTNITFHVTVTATSPCHTSTTQSFDLTLLAP